MAFTTVVNTMNFLEFEGVADLWCMMVPHMSRERVSTPRCIELVRGRSEPGPKEGTRRSAPLIAVVLASVSIVSWHIRYREGQVPIDAYHSLFDAIYLLM